MNKLNADEGCFIYLGGATAERGVGVMPTKKISLSNWILGNIRSSVAGEY